MPQPQQHQQRRGHPYHHHQPPPPHVLYAPIDPLVAVAPVSQFAVRPPGASMSTLLMLESEIFGLLRYLSPSAGESHLRTAAFESVARVVTDAWPLSKTVLFGSVDTGLYLPNSDIDIVVHYHPTTPTTSHPDAAAAAAAAGVRPGAAPTRVPPELMHELAVILEESQVVTDIRVFVNAPVPLIKCRHRELLLDMDISMNHDDGENGARLTKSVMDSIPLLRQVVVVLKHALAHRGLNETYNGGLGSFALMVLVHFFCQRVIPNELRNPVLMAQANITVGGLLLGFLDYFGRLFDYGHFAIRMGGWFHKPSLIPGVPMLTLFLESPLHPDVDLGQSIYNLASIRQSFELAYLEIMNRMHNLQAMYLHRWQAAAALATPAPVAEPDKILLQAYVHLRSGGGAEDAEDGVSMLASPYVPEAVATDGPSDRPAVAAASQATRALPQALKEARKEARKEAASEVGGAVPTVNVVPPSAASLGGDPPQTPPPRPALAIRTANGIAASAVAAGSSSSTASLEGVNVPLVPLPVHLRSPELYLLAPLVGGSTSTMLGYRAQLHGQAVRHLSLGPDGSVGGSYEQLFHPAAPVPASSGSAAVATTTTTTLAAADGRWWARPL